MCVRPAPTRTLREHSQHMAHVLTTERVPLGHDDYMRLLGAFDEMARCFYRIKCALGRAVDRANRIPAHHRRKQAQAEAVVAPLRELARQMQEEIDRTRAAVDWESARRG